VRRWISTVVLTAACAPPSIIVPYDVEPGDVVLTVHGADDMDTAGVAISRIGEDGATKFSEAAQTAIAVIRQRDVRDLTGARQSLDGLTADLDGDAEGACGCLVPPLDGDTAQVIAPGDRCALAASSTITLTGERGNGESIIAGVRARLRVTWPGACACRRRPFAELAEITMCPLGEEAERQDVVVTRLRRDGSVVLGSSFMVTDIALDGTRSETRIEPPISELKEMIALPNGGALVIATVNNMVIDRTEYVYVPPRGAGSPRRIDLAPSEYELTGHRTTSDGLTYLFGEAPLIAISRPLLVRCDFRGRIEDAGCIEVPLPVGADCPQHRRSGSIRSLAELGSGDLVGLLNNGGQIYVHDGQGMCVPGSSSLTVTRANGEPADVAAATNMRNIGRRLVACVNASNGPDALTMVVTATVPSLAGPMLAPLEWQSLSESNDDDTRCASTMFVDPREPNTVILIGDSGTTPMRLRVTGTTVTPYSRRATHPELDSDIRFTSTTTSAIAVLTQRSETWMRRAGEPAFRRIDAVRARHDVGHAVLARSDGFKVYTATDKPIFVRVGPEEGCDAARVEIPDGAFDATGEDTDDDVVSFGDGAMLFGKRGGERVLLVLDASDRVVSTLPTRDSAVGSAVEIIPGKWVAVRFSDGHLDATDGKTIVPLDPDPIWLRIRGRHGVAWTATEEELARVVPRTGGGLVLERDVVERIDARAMASVGRDDAPVNRAFLVLCDGRVLVGYHESEARAPGIVGASTIWVVGPVDGRLTMAPYLPYVQAFSHPYGQQSLIDMAGDSATPVLLFGGTSADDNLHAPGIVSASLPISGASVTNRGSDMLFQSNYFRMTYVRVRAAD